ncbi:MAG: hypothetical protein ACLPYS_05015 [Vulcanimicrobiaceae bacterium]
MFVVVGAQRTGTNLLREILNTNDEIAMLGEIFSPSEAPAHWDNFVRAHPAERVSFASHAELEALLDRYFDFVRYRIHNYWEGNRKSRSSALGVDVKYNQLRSIQPGGRCGGAKPFLVDYLSSRGFTLVHTIRRNVIESALSALIASQRGLWHNYEGALLDRSYHIDADECLACARNTVGERAAFCKWAEGSGIVTSYYDELLRDVARAGPDGVIPEGPGSLLTIARALDVPFSFRYDGRLQKAINVPYSRVIANFDELLRSLASSEFWAYAAALHG